MNRVIVRLEKNELAALVNLAQRECRDPRQQAAAIIRQELERRGLLQADAQPQAEHVKVLQKAEAGHVRSK